MQFSDKTLRPAYNGEVAVDGKENVIVACHLTDEATDHNQLQPLLEHMQDNNVHSDNAVADASFYSHDNARYLEKKISQATFLTTSLQKKRRKRPKNSGNPSSATMKKRIPSPARENIRSPSTTSRHERMHPISKSTREQIVLTVP